MPQTNRSQRQITGLLRIREWHLDKAIRAQLEGNKQEANFHFRSYDLLGPALEHPVGNRSG